MSRRPHPIRTTWPGLEGAPDRREVLAAMAATMALAVTGCDDGGDRRAIPYVVQPEEVAGGRPLTFATAVTFAGWARPVLAEVHMGRPTRLDGNGAPPAGSGAADPFMQAEVLNLYDPDRSHRPLAGGAPTTPERVEGLLRDLDTVLLEGGGHGVHLLTGRITSPTESRLITALAERFPAIRWHAWEPAEDMAVDAGTRLAFGRPLALHPRLDRAGAIVCLGADPLGPGAAQIRHGAQWGARRAARRHTDQAGPSAMADLLVAEPTPSLTGLQADRRLAVPEGRLPSLLRAIAQALDAEPGLEAPAITLPERAFATAAAEQLAASGRRALLLTGHHPEPAFHALALRINDRLGALGHTLVTTDTVALPQDEPGHTIADLEGALTAGKVRALLVLDANPVLTLPALGSRLAAFPFVLHAGTMADETARIATLHLPLLHALERWGDARDLDGTASILQPTIQPLVPGWTVARLLARLAGQMADEFALTRATWADRLDEEGWREALRAGFVPGTAAAEVAAATHPVRPPLPSRAPSGLELVVRPDPAIWDGRYANNAWLRELPGPVTKLTWTNAVALSPALAARLGLETGGRVEVAVGDMAVAAPVLVLPGQAEGSVTVWLGHGRTGLGRNADGRGVDAYPLAEAARTGAPVRLRALEGAEALPLAQLEGSMHGRELARAVPLSAPRVDVPASAPPPLSLYPDWEYPGRRWAMAIDLDACIGCSACVIACQAENSIPTVGAEEVRRGRLMHWIRVERYWSPEDEAGPPARFLPVPCMHCEKAPCEVGCPVNATVHDAEGLNQMVYNRCVGTRTCQAYCPYQVRRFNYLDYPNREPEAVIPQRNPDVTVRARGVMEKCTYCVQRIRAAEPGEKVITACAAACPTAAIRFGDLNDPADAVTALHDDPRAYVLLRALGTRPRTFYLARVEDREDGT